MNMEDDSESNLNTSASKSRNPSSSSSTSEQSKTKDSESASSSHHSSGEEFVIDIPAPKKRPRRTNTPNPWDINPSLFNVRRSGRNPKPKIISDNSTEENSSSESEDRSSSSSAVSFKISKPNSRQKKASTNSKRTTRHAYKKELSNSESDKKPKYYESSSNTEDYIDSNAEETEYIAPVVEDPNISTIDKVLDHRLGHPANVGAATTKYHDIMTQRGSAVLEDLPEVEQYFIKWQNWSHLHNTWESKNSLELMKAKGMKKLENYIKNTEITKTWLSTISVEEAEFFYCQNQAQKDLLEKNQLIDKIIFERESNPSQDGNTSMESNPDDFEYFVKWKGLPYSCATFESKNLIDKMFPQDVEFYKNRLQNQFSCRSVARITRPKVNHDKIDSSGIPKWCSNEYRENELNLPKLEQNLMLRDYQVDGVNWLAHAWLKSRSCIKS